jgi:hypothetical protein
VCSTLILRRTATILRFAGASTCSWFLFAVHDSEGFSIHPESAIVDAWQRGKPTMSLKAMSVSQLKALRREVESAVRAKVSERRREIESELSELSELSRLDGGRAKVVRAGASGMVAVKVGKKPKASTPNQQRKTRKARNTRKAANRVETGFSTLAIADQIEPIPIETRPVASIDANVGPADLSVAA